MDVFVSVIIPVYNKEPFVNYCVGSVLSQTYRNIEVILVNDGSTDNSLAICKQIAKNDPRVILIDQNNQGVSAARNRGIETATGKYICFLDADDSLPEDAIEALVEAAEELDSDMTIGRSYEDQDIPIGVFEGENYLKKVLEDHIITYSTWSILYKLEFVQDLRFPEGRIVHEDSYFIFLCALKKPKVATINTVVYNYNAVPNSASRSSFTIKKYDDICELLAVKEEKIQKDYPHLLPLFYHLKTKIQMMLLMNLGSTSGEKFRKKEKETLVRFNQVKKYFQADLPYSNAVFYNILTNNLYYIYKVFAKFKRAIRCIFQR